MLVPKTSQAARNRYIYYPDRLNRLPNSILSILLSPTLPAMKGVLGGILSEPFRRRRPKDLEDESVGSFLTRRFNSALANNLASAVLHGIYAGDVNKLSAKSLFPGLWAAEASHGSLFKSLVSVRRMEEHERDRAIREELQSDNAEICARMEGTSVFSFRGGIETLVSALLRDLDGKPNVTIKTGSTVSGIEYDGGRELPVQVSFQVASEGSAKVSFQPCIDPSPIGTPCTPHLSRIPLPRNFNPPCSSASLPPSPLPSFSLASGNPLRHCPRRKPLFPNPKPPPCPRLRLPHPQLHREPRVRPRRHLRL